MWQVSLYPTPNTLGYKTNYDYSELHVFRGHQPSKTGFIMGHEFTGTVVEKGDDVKTLEVGDVIVSPFTTSWYVCSSPTWTAWVMALIILIIE